MSIVSIQDILKMRENSWINWIGNWIYFLKMNENSWKYQNNYLLYDQENESGMSFPLRSASHLFTSISITWLFSIKLDTKENRKMGNQFLALDLEDKHHCSGDDGHEWDEAARSCHCDWDSRARALASPLPWALPSSFTTTTATAATITKTTLSVHTQAQRQISTQTQQTATIQ